MEIWQKIKNLYTGDSRWFTWFVTLWLLYFTWSWLFGSGNTIFHGIEAKEEYRRINASIEYYKNEIDRMDMIIDQRESNLDTLEKFAREQYHFAAPGEDVYIIE
jgi:cell division protein FtsB